LDGHKVAQDIALASTGSDLEDLSESYYGNCALIDDEVEVAYASDIDPLINSKG
jgi:hypothetical protein